ncbi:MAG: hypothetical protein XD62_0622 [Methanosarcinales archeaon 56_1174]|nr:MAG: hypothetical protein XD62_0622 [Methanosarcinales archeaon 56_1174]
MILQNIYNYNTSDALGTLGDILKTEIDKYSKGRVNHV